LRLCGFLAWPWIIDFVKVGLGGAGGFFDRIEKIV
jgi:hypothetical protein